MPPQVWPQGISVSLLVFQAQGRFFLHVGFQPNHYPGWRNPESLGEWQKWLQKYCLPTEGQLQRHSTQGRHRLLPPQQGPGHI